MRTLWLFAMMETPVLWVISVRMVHVQEVQASPVMMEIPARTTVAVTQVASSRATPRNAMTATHAPRMTDAATVPASEHRLSATMTIYARQTVVTLSRAV